MEWVPAHKDIQGNKEADRLAKQASFMEPVESCPLSFAFVNLKMEDIKFQKWNRLVENYELKRQEREEYSAYTGVFPWQTRRKPWVPSGTRKEICSAFYQLKLGHGFYKSYMKRIRQSTVDICSCGPKQTPKHLLPECWRYKQNRKRMKERIGRKQMSIQDLLHSTVGITAALEFLNDTRISTRGWYIREEKDENQI